MAIAEHAPEKLYARNKGMLRMKSKSLHEFAATPRSGLPKRAGEMKPRANRAPVMGGR